MKPHPLHWQTAGAARAARERAAHRWWLAGVAVLIFSLGFVTACAVIGHYFFPTP